MIEYVENIERITSRGNQFLVGGIVVAPNSFELKFKFYYQEKDGKQFLFVLKVNLNP